MAALPTCSGNPLNVVRWLSQFLLARGSMLRAGDIVMSGSIVATGFPPAGTACRFALDGLPDVRLRIPRMRRARAWTAHPDQQGGVKNVFHRCAQSIRG